MKVYPIVEGHGEVQAVPVLLRRILSEAQRNEIGVGPPIRRKQSQLRTKEGIQVSVRLALKQPDCAAILVIFDADDNCPKELATKVRAWAKEACQGKPCEVVLAVREYETWFLAAMESLRGKHGILPGAVAPACPESKRDAKRVLDESMPPRRPYSETKDQPAMSADFDLSLAYCRNRSFRKLVKSIGEILQVLTPPLATWPPTHWRTD